MPRLLLAFLLFSSFSFGQANNPTLKVDLEPILYVPNIFCLEDEYPILKYLPDSIIAFEFILFNRWGEEMACTDNPNFKLIDILCVPKEAIKEGTYTYVVWIQCEGEEMHRYVGHSNFLGYCGC